MRRSPLTIQQILRWADDHYVRAGDWPNQHSGSVDGAPGETWNRVSRALLYGRRGLPEGWTLPRLLTEERGARLPWHAPALSIPQILEWAVTHYRRTGSWPNGHSGPIVDSPGETWSAVNSALDRGHRGLPGGTTLPRLLHDRLDAPLRCPRRKVSRLTVEQILDWADAHRRRTGEWPKLNSGDIEDAPGETWGGMAIALQTGRRGLPKGMTLAEFLSRRRGFRVDIYAPRLTIEIVLGWADAHHRRTGRWPQTSTGAVVDAPGESWQAINNSLNIGLRGLPGGTTLPRLLHEERAAPLLLIPQGVFKTTVSQVLAWAAAHQRRTGKWPTSESGVVQEAAPKTWRQIDSALSRGYLGLPRGTSLARLLLEQHGVRRTLHKSKLTIEQILRWVDVFHRRNGAWPATNSGWIETASDEKWSAVDQSLRTGGRGLPKCSGLAGLLAEHRGVRRRASRLKKTRILAWADAFHERNGIWPTPRSGPIEEAPGETWKRIDRALQSGSRGLARSSLTKLLTAHRGVRNSQDLPRVTPVKILAWADAFHRRVGKWPTADSGAVSAQSQENWLSLDQSLRTGGRGLAGGSSLARLLEQERGVLRPQSKPKLSIPQILVWADAYHRRHGKWPLHDSGPAADGTGTTWAAIESALRRGLRGLKGGSSLTRLLTEHRGKRNAQGQKKLSIATVLAWADAHRQRTGAWPVRISGAIAESPRDSWDRIDLYLRNGIRGLPTGSSLARLLAERRGVRNLGSLPELTVQQILGWADEHHCRTGRWPTRSSGIIPGSNSETWLSVVEALYHGRRGLPKNLTLAKLLDQHRRGGRGMPDKSTSSARG